MDEYIGSILPMAFNWSPQGWYVCHGQVLSINQYQALFALIGATYGGDGVANFKIPDLRKKNSGGNYYQPGEIMEDGTPYIESCICVEGIFPQRP
jgi:microcystin-dependent protein